MAQDPCAFNFIYTNYSDEKALFANFRHLQEHLNRIGCGSGVEDASWVMAASDSSAADKERADEVCTGVDDQITIRDAILNRLPAGGQIGFLPGHYNFSAGMTNADAGGNNINEVFSQPLRFRGSTGVFFRFSANPAAADYLFRSGDIGVGKNDPQIIFENIRFEGGASGSPFSNADGVLITFSVGNQPRWQFHDCTFYLWGADYVFWTERNFRLNISTCHFVSCNPTVSFFHLGGFSQGHGNIHNNEFSSCSGVVWTGAGFTMGAIITGNNFSGGMTIPSPDPWVYVYHNRIAGVLVSGDHDGITHDHGSHTGLTDNDHPQYLLHSVADAKGDIAVATAADVWDNFPVGTNNYGLFADSAQTFGLQWRNTDRTLNVNVTAVGNITTGEDDLMSYAVPAATLGATGDWVDFNAAGTFAASINNKRLRVKFGATTIFDTGALAITAATDWSLEGQVIRTGAATQKCFVRLNTSSATLAAYADYSTAAETLANAITLKLTGEATDTNDIVEETLTVRFIPAP